MIPLLLPVEEFDTKLQLGRNIPPKNRKSMEILANRLEKELDKLSTLECPYCFEEVRIGMDQIHHISGEC